MGFEVGGRTDFHHSGLLFCIFYDEEVETKTFRFFLSNRVTFEVLSEGDGFERWELRLTISRRKG